MCVVVIVLCYLLVLVIGGFGIGKIIIIVWLLVLFVV